ncbi:hypothetical protein GBAR_LOCUS15997 [Geodia barretti]|uniref:Uncharacterized protein n=1 Tax=Geodia barretti TaxID=519541 RepID=A0AA35WVH1_GEOBA|nr:hypothetical protein GBAR_LOCUS15997 [Geodia barretti]
METGVIAVEMKEGGREGAGEDDDEVSGSQNHDSRSNTSLEREVMAVVTSHVMFQWSRLLRPTYSPRISISITPTVSTTYVYQTDYTGL